MIDVGECGLDEHSLLTEPSSQYAGHKMRILCRFRDSKADRSGTSDCKKFFRVSLYENENSDHFPLQSFPSRHPTYSNLEKQWPMLNKYIHLLERTFFSCYNFFFSKYKKQINMYSYKYGAIPLNLFLRRFFFFNTFLPYFRYGMELSIGWM